MFWRMWMGLACVLVLVSLPAEVSARELSIAIKTPAVTDGAWFRSQVEKRLRSEMLSQGFAIQSSVSKGFHLVYQVSLAETGGSKEAPECVVLFDLRIISKPENRQVMKVQASGKANYDQPTALDTEKRRNLRGKAVTFGSRAIVEYLNKAFQQIDEAMQRLGKGQVLGQKVGISAMRGGGGGSVGPRPSPSTGKPLPGRPMLRKLSPPQLEPSGSRPPLTFEG